MICPYCGNVVERDKGVAPEPDKVGMYKNRLYHPACYLKALEEPKNKWPINVKKAQADGDEFVIYQHMIIDYFNVELKVSPNPALISIQLKKYAKLASYEDVMMAVHYVYEIKHMDKHKSNGAIGIIPYVLEESQAYFQKHNLEKIEFARKVKEQMEAFANREKIIIKREEKKKPKLAYITDDDE